MNINAVAPDDNMDRSPPCASAAQSVRGPLRERGCPDSAFPCGRVPHAMPAAEPIDTVAEAYAQLRGALLAYLRKHTGDAQVAEDLLHDVVVKALLASRDEAHAPQNLTGWLYAVARNAAMDHHRRQRPTDELPEDLATPTAGDEDAAVIELANCLRPMAERLPDTYRATVIACELDGQPLARVADAQGLSLSAVKTRASRGRRLLQKELVECCRVALSAKGQVLDYDATAAAMCAPAGSGRLRAALTTGWQPRELSATEKL
ncbi:sigma-70 family RNA polymerase sigma factor [Acidovorax sp.]|uniref:sigma-70 family RNA polymerase sigma factor n=1 Tax=Acidovorax sp. TaxID=1872122 RepID=UPI002ACD663D|nr:sigma-70 family RNA polymerase sigma factor [Acidovorax sp.]MDZ7865956.1 sigma-70 family RNA polymerase sigma factor [Acidovorax sp.]